MLIIHQVVEQSHTRWVSENHLHAKQNLSKANKSSGCETFTGDVQSQQIIRCGLIRVRIANSELKKTMLNSEDTDNVCRSNCGRKSCPVARFFVFVDVLRKGTLTCWASTRSELSLIFCVRTLAACFFFEFPMGSKETAAGSCCHFIDGMDA